ncbi:hypothetical protein G6F46_010571 [Rhizopus delemar]|uniref:Uncharacterized protein n=3 Tax=Rhizopus TaxID=4842 RepID=I1BW69_RHIO9|nr:hypothetical protein RO3G_05154 [Rhizopus delemar RA 99-880]KAG1450288.1 hypothetical protein G6F55_009757 [Rhizopus delemar]KAG1537066.1 hypothetical protein G6F51_010600 [Rhizopus arrhizus]KAG1491263.1 hypothetical protein G6F54_010147 [Rhizopus delemar]KAG1504890.1 hypothetical protein G6F53_010300 [Rhizopus delemar]|eukprot:EIE80449.1 hypothetical protein RO3G_05154 [Rhizopus delemar RA 99-880]
MSDEFQPYRLSSEVPEEFERLVELQRRYTESRDPNVDNIAFDTDDDDDFSVHAKHMNAPPIPDMRYEKQVETAIQNLRNKGTSPLGIFWTVVIKDQIIVPFISGFVWCVGTHAWSWYRSRGAVKNSKKTIGFFRGLHHGISEWTKSIYNVIISSNTASIE